MFEINYAANRESVLAEAEARKVKEALIRSLRLPADTAAVEKTHSNDQQPQCNNTKTLTDYEKTIITNGVLRGLGTLADAEQQIKERELKMNAPKKRVRYLITDDECETGEMKYGYKYV